MIMDTHNYTVEFYDQTIKYVIAEHMPRVMFLD